jgi:hypothetical protein
LDYAVEPIITFVAVNGGRVVTIENGPLADPGADRRRFVASLKKRRLLALGSLLAVRSCKVKDATDRTRVHFVEVTGEAAKRSRLLARFRQATIHDATPGNLAARYGISRSMVTIARARGWLRVCLKA